MKRILFFIFCFLFLEAFPQDRPDIGLLQEIAGSEKRIYQDMFKSSPGFVGENYGWNYAVDIAKLQPWGGYSSFIFALDHPAAFAAYGEPVYSPCAGKIVSISETSLAIELNASTVVRLLHLQEGSIQIHVGDQVNTGDMLARIGNAGSAIGITYPHLHIEVWDAVKMEYTPFLLDGKYAYTNRVFP